MAQPRARKYLSYAHALDARGAGAAAPEADRARARACIAEGTDLDAHRHVAMLEALAEAAPADFALRFGAARRLVDMGIVGHAILSSGTLRQALGIWNNFSGLAGDPFTYRSGLSGGRWFNDIHPALAMSPTLVRFHAEEWVASFCRFAFETTGAIWTLAEIEFRHRPGEGVAYDAALPARPRFAAGRNRITLPEAYLDLPVLSHDDEMMRLLDAHFARQRPTDPAAPLTARLERMFFAAAGRVPKLAEAAADLGLSARTLNRRLAEEGTSYSDVLARYRRDYAEALARERSLGTKQIAHAIGYRSHQSLRRAFTHWTGEPLGRWRGRQGQA